jgi:hypothetical protein
MGSMKASSSMHRAEDRMMPDPKRAERDAQIVANWNCERAPRSAHRR